MKKLYFRLMTSVSSATKLQLTKAAAAEMLTESAWVRRAVIRTLECRPEALNPSEFEERPTLRGVSYRQTVRIRPEDGMLLEARALARGMRPATYLSVLVRAYLRRLTPLPKDELLALKRAVSELGAITRELHRIAHLLEQGGQGNFAQPDVGGVARLCEVVRNETKALIKANVNSWELGHRHRCDGSESHNSGSSVSQIGTQSHN